MEPQDIMVISSGSESDGSPETTPLPRERKPVHSCPLCYQDPSKPYDFDREWEQVMKGGCPRQKAEERKRRRERRQKRGIETIVIIDSE